MWLTRSWSWVRAHPALAAIFAVVFLVVVGFAWSAYRYRSEAITAKQEIRKKVKAMEDLAQKEEIQRDAWQRRVGDTETRLSRAQGEIRTLRGRLGEIEARRRDLFVPPAIDNLAARFDRAVMALK
jgi:uncharacterized protein HemX